MSDTIDTVIIPVDTAELASLALRSQARQVRAAGGLTAERDGAELEQLADTLRRAVAEQSGCNCPSRAAGGDCQHTVHPDDAYSQDDDLEPFPQPSGPCPRCGAEEQCYDGDAENGPCAPSFWHECYCLMEAEDTIGILLTIAGHGDPRLDIDF